jgi:hypothetical protein
LLLFVIKGNEFVIRVYTLLDSDEWIEWETAAVKLFTEKEGCKITMARGLI